METTVLPAERRAHLGTKHTRRLRERGQIPAIVYGHKEDPDAIALDAHELGKLLQHHARVLHVKLDNKDEQFLIKSIQYDYLGTTPIHLDLMRVDLDERVTVQVEITLRGEAAGTHDGGLLLQALTELEVSCLVTAIPDELRLAINELGVGSVLYARDVSLPEGVELVTDPDEVVVSCRMPAAAAEPAEGEAEEGEADSAEPEVINKGKAEEEDS